MGLFDFLGSLATAGANVASTSLTNQANKELAQYSYEQQQKMIDAQNQYNSPSAQMKRYQDAGLNPNLVYGQIGSGNQSQIAKYEAPTMQAPKIANVLGDMLDLTAKSQQIKNLAEEGKSKELTNEAKRISNEYNRSILNNRIRRYQLDYDTQMARKLNIEVTGDIARWRQQHLLPEQLLNVQFQNTTLNPLKRNLLQEQIKHQGIINQYAEPAQVLGLVNSGIGALSKIIMPLLLGRFGVRH